MNLAFLSQAAELNLMCNSFAKLLSHITLWGIYFALGL